VTRSILEVIVVSGPECGSRGNTRERGHTCAEVRVVSRRAGPLVLVGDVLAPGRAAHHHMNRLTINRSLTVHQLT